MESFHDYFDAYDYAVEQTKKLGLDHGIERGEEYGNTVFNVFLLPKPEFCFGHELRCERVTLLSPRVTHKRGEKALTQTSPTFTLNIKLDNDAFSDGNEASEVSRILRSIANRLEADGCATVPDAGYLFDINGNRVGHYARGDG